MPTIEQLERNLPNGFHDARLRRLTIDYSTAHAAIALDVLVNDEREPD